MKLSTNLVVDDPHTGAELGIDEIVSLCDDLFEAHAGWLPELI